VKRSASGALLSVVAAAALCVGTSPAHAINRYTVEANSPKPAACNNSGTVAPGTWIQNKVCGYFIGTAMAGSSFDVNSTDSGTNYHWGRDYGDNDFCGWIPPGALSASPTGTADPSCSDTTQATMSHRLDFGKNYNAVAHTVNGASPITVNPSCEEYYNYFNSSSFTTGTLRDAAGTPASATIGYRYTTNDGQAMVVDDPNLGWGFMSLSCVTSWDQVTFHNDND
jgi:hypothetical protein